MSKKTQPKTTAAKVPLQGFPSWTPIASHAETVKAFCDSQPKSKASNGQNTCLAEFLFVMKFIVENMRVFTIQDCLQLSRGKDLDATAVKNLFHAYTEKAVADGRLKRTAGVYDSESFQIL
jgi:hypothetical protein